MTGSTELGASTDPEALRALLARYFERMRRIVESHGGSVEKFIGDAVMAVFGVPVTHEDDALRACRAAVEMRDALPELRIAGRIGVNTGEVVTGTEERLATGDAVNVAARLEQVAQPGEVLIGEETLRLVGPTVSVGEERRLDLKGKAESVAAYPLLEVTGELERTFSTPMVGRGRELQGLRDAFARADADRSCQLFTVLGSAGVGKSRLASEFLAEGEARVVRGRCLSYGEGITYWPVVEILKQLGTLPEGDAARPLQSLLGETQLPASAEEIAWGFRKLLEQEAQMQPLVCVFDDLHWAEETLFDLVEHVAELSRDASILLLCMARPELLERRPSWGGGKWNATTVLLEPLDAGEAEQLLSELGEVPSELYERIVQVAEGNPLFLEEILALVRDSPSGEVEVPPTIQALLAARLDQLEPAERSVLEHGSVEGRTFHRGAVAALAEDDGDVDRRLVALVRKELVRPERGQLAGDDAYRFRHLLIRDAAYDALPKGTRAELHRRFAAWLEQHGQSLVEVDEILGYHLEQAALYLAELGRPEGDVAREASARLAAAGERARWRSDLEAAHSLLRRAITLVEEPDVHLAVGFAMSHFVARDAEPLLNEAARRADANADAAGAAHARALAAQMRLWTGKGSADEAEQLGLAALPLLEERQDHAGLADIWFSLANGAYNFRCRCDQIAHAAEMARHYETLVGRPHDRSDALSAMALMEGPTPVGEALQLLDRLDSTWVTDSRRALLLAMSDRIDEARALAHATEQRSRELGREVYAPGGELEALFGNHEAAAGRMGAWCDWLERRGQSAGVAGYAAIHSRELCLANRYEDAEQRATHARELSQRLNQQDPLTQSLWRQATALVASHRGDHTEAERLAREALTHILETDSPTLQADAYCDLAEVLKTAGRHEDAITAWREALDRYERKGVILLARRVRERLDAVQAVHE